MITKSHLEVISISSCWYHSAIFCSGIPGFGKFLARKSRFPTAIESSLSELFTGKLASNEAPRYVSSTINRDEFAENTSRVTLAVYDRLIKVLFRGRTHFRSLFRVNEALNTVITCIVRRIDFLSGRPNYFTLSSLLQS